MVHRTVPDATVDTIQVAERGFCTVYEVTLDCDGGAETLFLKASPDGQPWGIPTEARLQGLLHDRTEIPVPQVLGVVDDDEDLPTPYYCMRGLPGNELAYETVARLEAPVLERLARETGRHLGMLHRVPAPEQFGHVRHDGPSLSGGRPDGSLDGLTVGDPHDDWPSFLHTYAESELQRHQDSRFDGLSSTLERWVHARIDDLEGPFSPAFGRNDHGLHNLLVDRDTGEVTGVLDWGYTLVVPPAFDVAFATYIYGGSYLAAVPDCSDRQSTVREALCSGYEAVAPDRVDAVRRPDPLYQVLAMTRIMNDFEHLEVPDGREGAVAEQIERDVRALIETHPA